MLQFAIHRSPHAIDCRSVVSNQEESIARLSALGAEYSTSAIKEQKNDCLAFERRKELTNAKY
jgi:hypothetical protein